MNGTKSSHIRFHTDHRNSSKTAESGSFVLWQMNPDIWYVELLLGASKVHVDCNGRLVWRHTPWLGAHAAEGPVRPLRRALQVIIFIMICLYFYIFFLSKMPFLFIRFDQLCDFRSKVCFSAYGSKRFKILPFSSGLLTPSVFLR
ncbi:hypothetical protein Hanom_Chr04g00343221 [Helianthus anomalus]